MEIIFIILVIYVIFKIRKWWNGENNKKSNSYDSAGRLIHKELKKSSKNNTKSDNTKYKKYYYKNKSNHSNYSNYKYNKTKYSNSNYSRSNDNKPGYVIHKKSYPTEKQKEFATLLARRKGLTLHEAARRRFPRTPLRNLNRQHFADLIDWLLD